jgi:hypothetical protein
MYSKDLDDKDDDVDEDDSVYTEGKRDELVDDDEISLQEDAFMDGYEGQGVGKPVKKPAIDDEGNPKEEETLKEQDNIED